MVYRALLAESETGFSSLSALSSITIKFFKSEVTMTCPYAPVIKFGIALFSSLSYLYSAATFSQTSIAAMHESSSLELLMMGANIVINPSM